MKIIGLGHYSRTGKDTLANAIISHSTRPAKKIPFAWKLKQQSHELYAWAGLREPEFYDTPAGEKLRDVVLPALGKTPVEIWVIVGNMYRDKVYIGTWIDFVLRTDHQVDLLVIPDVRYPNEVQALRTLGATLVKVVRPGFGPKDTVADKALLYYREWDYVVGASGDINELNEWGRTFAQASDGKYPWPDQLVEDRVFGLNVEAPIQPARSRAA